MNQETFNKLKQQLILLPHASYASGKREVVMRCPFCGDSKKHSDSTHFYVKIDINFSKNELPVYYCQHCHSRGIADSNFLRRISIIDHNIISELNQYIYNAMQAAENKIFKIGRKIRLINPKPSNIPQSIEKIKYLNGRLGLKLNIDDLIKLKICLNLYDLLDYNKVDKLTIKESACNILDQHYVGFISYDNAYVNCRKVTDNIDGKRYDNYNIFGKYDNTKRFYVLPTRVNILDPKPLDIYITEGVFDILSVFFNVNNCNTQNSVYIAVGGTGYYNVIDYFIKFGFIHHNIHIFSDNDVNIDFYKDMKENLGDKIDGKLNIYYNNYKGEKDFGVPKEKIKIIHSKI
jgi:hypothetical protein